VAVQLAEVRCTTNFMCGTTFCCTREGVQGGGGGGGECSLVAKDGSGFGLTMRKIGGGAVFCLDRNGDGGSGVRSGRCLFYRGG
jgi:hypothetical protein